MIGNRIPLIGLNGNSLYVQAKVPNDDNVDDGSITGGSVVINPETWINLVVTQYKENNEVETMT